MHAFNGDRQYRKGLGTPLGHLSATRVRQGITRPEPRFMLATKTRLGTGVRLESFFVSFFTPRSHGPVQ
jgi:hypothetical protein